MSSLLFFLLESPELLSIINITVKDDCYPTYPPSDSVVLDGLFLFFSPECPTSGMRPGLDQSCLCGIGATSNKA